MATKRILFPTDLSKESLAALEMATSLARTMDAKLLIVHAEEPVHAYTGGNWYADPTQSPTDELQRLLAEIVPSDPDVGYEHRLIMDKPAEGITRLAREAHADMIVMATHGRSGVSRVLLGSVAEEVVRTATCPVLIYKANDK